MDLTYLKRLAEESLYAAVGAASAVLMSGGGLDKVGIMAALGAAARAVLGVLAKTFGDRGRPSVL